MPHLHYRDKSQYCQLIACTRQFGNARYVVDIFSFRVDPSLQPESSLMVPYALSAV